MILCLDAGEQGDGKVEKGQLHYCTVYSCWNKMLKWNLIIFILFFFKYSELLKLRVCDIENKCKAEHEHIQNSQKPLAS